MNDKTQTPNWWWRLLRRPGWLTVLAVCLLLSAVFMPFSWRYYRTLKLVAEIEAQGGNVVFKQSGPQWLRKAVGNEWMKPFDTPDQVSWAATLSYIVGIVPPKEKLTDAKLSAYVVPLDDLYGIKTLLIDNSSLTPLGFKELARFEDLENFSVGDKSFDDDALANLSKAYKLRSLDLSGTSVSDMGLRHLQGLKNLKSLALSNTDVTDEGVSDLQRQLPGLEISDD